MSSISLDFLTQLKPTIYYITPSHKQHIKSINQFRKSANILIKEKVMIPVFSQDELLETIKMFLDPDYKKEYENRIKYLFKKFNVENLKSAKQASQSVCRWINQNI